MENFYYSQRSLPTGYRSPYVTEIPETQSSRESTQELTQESTPEPEPESSPTSTPESCTLKRDKRKEAVRPYQPYVEDDIADSEGQELPDIMDELYDSEEERYYECNPFDEPIKEEEEEDDYVVPSRSPSPDQFDIKIKTRPVLLGLDDDKKSARKSLKPVLNPAELDPEIRFTKDDATEKNLEILFEYTIGNIFESNQVEQIGNYITKLEAENERLKSMVSIDTSELVAENARLNLQTGSSKTFFRRFLISQKQAQQGKKEIFHFKAKAYEECVKDEVKEELGLPTKADEDLKSFLRRPYDRTDPRQVRARNNRVRYWRNRESLLRRNRMRRFEAGHTVF